MARTAPPEVRRALIERAADLLARREPVTLRSLVAGTGASTMAVYTHFGGMPGLWRAVRQEGFTRLAARLDATRQTRDAVRDLAALGAAYAANALANPDLYRAMFDARVELEDPEAAGASFDALVAGVERARDQGRFAADVDPRATATRYWASGHGLASLAVSGVLPGSLAEHAPAVTVALFVAAGDDPARARRSVHAAWQGVALP